MTQVGLMLGDDSHSQTLRRFLPAVEKRGLRFLEPSSYLETSRQVWIVHQSELKHGGLIAPYIIVDNKDGADLCSVARKTLCSDYPPVAVWKKSVYASDYGVNRTVYGESGAVKSREFIGLYNAHHGRFHEILIQNAIDSCDCDWSAPNQQIPPDRLDRIKAPFGYGAFEHPQKILAYGDARAANADRPIDVCFAGWMEYDRPLIQRHRELCVEALERLSSKYRVEVHRGRPFQLDQYADMLFQSKCVVSPYGLGEACYRTYEGIFAGCIVIVPDCRHVAYLNTLWQCRPDFVDLEEIVGRVLSCFGDRRHRMAVRQELIDSLSEDAVADQLYADIVRAAEQ